MTLARDKFISCDLANLLVEPLIKMKTAVLVVALLAGLSLLGYLADFSGEDEVSSSATTSEAGKGPGDAPLPDMDKAKDISQAVTDVTRREQMEAAFSTLQESRRILKSRANLVKSRIWGLELPPDQAKDVSNTMKQAYVYLKNPAMLGAYFEVSAIEREARKVNAMLTELEQLDSRIREIRSGSEKQ